MLQERPQAHVAVGVEKVTAGAGLDTKQQIQDGAAQGGFAGLVGPHDQVEIARGLGQRHRAVGELAIA